MAGFARAGTTPMDLRAWYFQFGMVLIPGARVFVQSQPPNSSLVATPAIVKRVKRLAGSAAWHAVEYECALVTSFATLYQRSQLTVRALPTLQLGGGFIIASTVNPVANFFTPLDSLFSVLQLFLWGDWGAILEYFDAGLRYRGFAFVLILLTFGRMILLSTFTAFVIAWIARSSARRSKPATSSQRGLGGKIGLSRQSPDQNIDSDVASQLEGRWAIIFQDQSVCSDKATIQHLSGGKILMRCGIFERNPVKANVNGSESALTIQKKGNSQVNGKLEGLACILWDNGQTWRREQCENMKKRATGLNALPNIQHMNDDADSTSSNQSFEDGSHVRRPHMAHAASSFSAVPEDNTLFCAWRRSAMLENLAFMFLERCCPVEIRVCYDFFDKIYVPCLNLSAVYAAAKQVFIRMRSTFSRRVTHAQEFYETIQELLKNIEAPNVMNLDLSNLTARELEVIFQDKRQKVRIEQKVDLYLVSVVEVLLSKRDILEKSKVEYIREGVGSSAWHDEELTHIRHQISRLEDTRTMLRYDLYSCFVLPRTHFLRKQAAALAKSYLFNGIIFSCIVLNILTQSFDSPYLPGEMIRGQDVMSEMINRV
jgi:hypothetical protein